MSASVVRRALETEDDSSISLVDKSRKNSGKKKLKKVIKKKDKKLSPEELVKKNLKILKSLEFASKSKKYGQNLDIQDIIHKSRKKKKQDTAKESTAFTEEDFRKFEEEYFVPS